MISTYFTARSNQDFLLEYKKNLDEFWSIEDKYRPQSGYGWMNRREHQAEVAQRASATPEYKIRREYIAKNNIRLQRIAYGLGIGTRGKSIPPVAVGGAIIDFDFFDLILGDNTHGGVHRDDIYDRLNAIIGGNEEQARVEFRRIINPLEWLKWLLLFVIRMPFLLVKSTGFDVAKFEDHVVGKSAKLVYIVGLMFIALYYFGFTKDELIRILNRSP